MIISRLHPVAELLRGRPRQVEWVVFDSSRRDRRSRELARRCKAAGVSIRFAEREALDRLAGRGHQGVVARVASVPYASVDEVVTGRRGSRFLLVLDEIQDPHNLGAVLRVADAVGAAVVVPERGSAPLSEAVFRASAGAAGRVPVHRTLNLRRFLDRLGQEGFLRVGLDPQGTPIYQSDLSGDIALVLGNEGRGIRRLVREACDLVIRLPMAGGLGSLNVSTAASAAAYEVVRQRWVGGAS